MYPDECLIFIGTDVDITATKGWNVFAETVHGRERAQGAQEAARRREEGASPVRMPTLIETWKKRKEDA